MAVTVSTKRKYTLLLSRVLKTEGVQVETPYLQNRLCDFFSFDQDCMFSINHMRVCLKVENSTDAESKDHYNF